MKLAPIAAAVAVLWMMTPAASAPEVGDIFGTSTKCHDALTIKTIGTHFGTVFHFRKNVAALAALTWAAADKPPPIARELIVVVGRDGLVRVYAVADRQCVRRAVWVFLVAWMEIVMEFRSQLLEAP